MNLFYAVLTFVMAMFNLYRGFNGTGGMNLALGAMWLVIGIVFTVKHVKELKKEKKQLKEREE